MGAVVVQGYQKIMMLVKIFKAHMLLSSALVDPKENVYGKIHNVAVDSGIKDSLRKGRAATCNCVLAISFKKYGLLG